MRLASLVPRVFVLSSRKLECFATHSPSTKRDCSDYLRDLENHISHLLKKFGHIAFILLFASRFSADFLLCLASEGPIVDPALKLCLPQATQYLTPAGISCLQP